jgi:hypothetical protein
MGWFFRAVDWPDRGRVLAGQRQGFDNLFAPGIYEMVWENGKYEGGERLPLPRGLTVFGMARGTVRSTADTDTVAYNSSGYVRILDSQGDEQWVTNERYGGSAEFFEIKDKEDPKETVKRYVSPRLRLFDVDGDGVQEVFALRNVDSASAFARLRIFKNGRLDALKWDQLGLTPIWKTRELPKYISDFTLADMDGDKYPEVIAAVVQKSSSVMSKGSSYLAVFKLNPAETADAAAKP